MSKNKNWLERILETTNSNGDPIHVVWIGYAKHKSKRNWKYKTDYYATSDEAIAAAFEDGATEVHFGNL